MTEAAAQEGGGKLLKYGIIAGTAFAAALAGAGITAAIDYPWRFDAAMPWRAKPVPAIELAAALPAAPKRVAATTGAAAAAAPAPTAQPQAPTAAKVRAARRGPARKADRHAAPVVASAGVPPRPAPQPGIDARYDRAVAAECPRGLRGLLCREAVRWRLCRGHWSSVAAVGASRCRVGERQSAFPSAG